MIGRRGWRGRTAVVALCGVLAPGAARAVDLAPSLLPAPVSPLPSAAEPQPLPPADALGRVTLSLALIIGVNHAVDPELPVLRYADDDAARWDELFGALGVKRYLLTRADENTRRISPEAVARALEPRRAALTAAVTALAAAAAAAQARGVRVMLYVVYAGHGNLRGTEAYLALEDARLSGDDLERDVINRVHADETHLIVDACYSYFLAYGRGSGGSRREIHGFVPTEGLAHRSDVGLLLSTTSARESHEWEGFQSGVFSHEVRSGLYGAADLDGNGRVSYREIAAFVTRASAAIANERFRPDIFVRAPAHGTALLDLRRATARRLRIEATAETGHYLLEDTRGVRLADFHNAQGHAVSLLLPRGAGPYYLRRERDDEEYEITGAHAEGDAAPTTVTDTVTNTVTSLAELSSRATRVATRGAAHDAFALTFSLPFDDSALALFPERTVDLTAAGRAAPAPRPRWRTVGAVSAVGVAAASGAAALWLTLSARSLAADARHAPTQEATASLNGRLGRRTDWAAASYGVTAAAALTGLLLWWPFERVQPIGAVGSDVVTMGIVSSY